MITIVMIGLLIVQITQIVSIVKINQWNTTVYTKTLKDYGRQIEDLRLENIALHADLKRWKKVKATTAYLISTRGVQSVPEEMLDSLEEENLKAEANSEKSPEIEHEFKLEPSKKDKKAKKHD